jgi:hypothetical protein
LLGIRRSSGPLVRRERGGEWGERSSAGERETRERGNKKIREKKRKKRNRKKGREV